MATARTWIHRAVEDFRNTVKIAVGSLSIGGVAVTSIAAELNDIKTVNLAAATQALTALQSGEKFVGVVDAVFTLPAAATSKGVWYEFQCGALSAGTGLSISPAAADFVGGNGLTAVANKDLINAGATDRLGDYVKVSCDGTNWYIDGIIGTWSKEA